jgi:GWxTD domain-containing protein
MRKLRAYKRLVFVGFFLTFSLQILSSQVNEPKPTRHKNMRGLTVLSDSVWRKGMNEDVVYIITDQERADFAKLTTAQQHDQFVEDFWERRNPKPGSPENPFKEEHYHRIAYVNQHFAASVPGWQTDRGRFYIMYGPPDKVTRLPHSVTMRKKDCLDDFGRSVQESHSNDIAQVALDAEKWSWKNVKNVGHNVTLRFVDTCNCGEYHRLLRCR